MDIPTLEPDEATLQHAIQLDKRDGLAYLRENFHIPTKGDLKQTSLTKTTKLASTSSDDSTPSIYLCGNSLGLQPRRTKAYIHAHLETWASKGVYGHFKPLTETPIVPWLDMDDAIQGPMAAIVGARLAEVAVMQTLTTNLHLLMASFYRPTKERYKIIIEGKAFPSDHYMVESQIRHHNLDVAESMIVVDPPAYWAPLQSTSYINAIIDEHADSAAVLLLPGVQFYTGQLFDIEWITAHAQSKGIVVGWDLAHAAGNVPLQLHNWNVDFAAWCTYKYLNCGPGAIGGLFVHERHGIVSPKKTAAADALATNGDADTKSSQPREDDQGPASNTIEYTPRLSGWWGSSKSTRFAMTNEFTPMSGAAGWQLSNPSALDMASVMASLSVFGMTNMDALRMRSLKLTGCLESLLAYRSSLTVEHGGLLNAHDESEEPKFTIITPRDPGARGAQLSIRLAPMLLEAVMIALQKAGVVVDERRPDVIRVAPAPLYNSFEDVWRFVDVFVGAVRNASGLVLECIDDKAIMGDGGLNGGNIVEGGRHMSQVSATDAAG